MWLAKFVAVNKHAATSCKNKQKGKYLFSVMRAVFRKAVAGD